MSNSIPSRARAEADRFLDGEGRQGMLRGVNLGGECKVPYPDGGTPFPTDFSDHREVSFVGRPFPLDEANARCVLGRYVARSRGASILPMRCRR